MRRVLLLLALMAVMVIAGHVDAQPNQEPDAEASIEPNHEVDQDGDGFHDDIDECPEEPETRNGLEDDDGCPDGQTALGKDTDGDGFPDRLDECPNRPETRNGFEDEDGCPDRERTRPAPSRWDTPVSIPWAPDKHCGRTDDCHEAGECTWRGGECVVGSAADCRQAARCRDEGLCGVWKGKCAATSNSDCRHSRECTEEGDCYLDRAGHRCDDEPSQVIDGERRSASMMLAGVGLLGLGGVAVLVGATLTAKGALVTETECGRRCCLATTCWSCCDTVIEPDDTMVAAGVATLVAGSVTALVGLPLTVIGAKKVPRKNTAYLTPTVSIGPTGGSLTWRW